jgi:hypothetical protein
LIYTLPEATPARLFFGLFHKRIVGGAVGMWESRRERFPRAVGNLGNRHLVFEVFHSPAFPPRFVLPVFVP